MKKHMLFAAIALWLLVVVLAYRWELLSIEAEDLQHMLTTARGYVYLLFCAFFCLRLVFFIPSSVFIVTGALLFSPLEGIVLSSCCMLVTSSAIYAVGRQFTNSPIHRFISHKYPDVYDKMQSDKRYLFFTVLMPIAPTDVACFVAASLQMRYRTFIMTVCTAVVPFTAIYTFFGKAILLYPSAALGITAVLLLVFIIEVKVRRRHKEREADI